jgi:hypothetical protein
MLSLSKHHHETFAKEFHKKNMTESEPTPSSNTPEPQTVQPLEAAKEFSVSDVAVIEKAETPEISEVSKAAQEQALADEQAAAKAAALKSATMTFHVLPEVFSIMRLPVAVKMLPDFVFQSSFYTISRSHNEVSVVCEERLVVRHIDHYGLGNVAKISGSWRMMRLGVMDLSITGVAARFAGVLAESGINLNIIATYDTDYVMVPQAKLARAVKALREAGYTVEIE